MTMAAAHAVHARVVLAIAVDDVRRLARRWRVAEHHRIRDATVVDRRGVVRARIAVRCDRRLFSLEDAESLLDLFSGRIVALVESGASEHRVRPAA